MATLRAKEREKDEREDAGSKQLMRPLPRLRGKPARRLVRNLVALPVVKRPQDHSLLALNGEKIRARPIRLRANLVPEVSSPLVRQS